MGAPVLEPILAKDRITAARMLGCHVPPDLLFERIPAAIRLLQLRADPNIQPWLLRAMIDRASGTMGWTHRVPLTAALGTSRRTRTRWCRTGLHSLPTLAAAEVCHGGHHRTNALGVCAV